MKTYLYRGRYTSKAWQKLIAEPKDIGEVMRENIESFGGRVIGCFVAKSTDSIGFIEFPDDLTASAWAVNFSSQDGVDFAEIEPVISTVELFNSLQVAAKKIGDAGASGGW